MVFNGVASEEAALQLWKGRKVLAYLLQPRQSLIPLLCLDHCKVLNTLGTRPARASWLPPCHWPGRSTVSERSQVREAKHAVRWLSRKPIPPLCRGFLSAPDVPRPSPRHFPAARIEDLSPTGMVVTDPSSGSSLERVWKASFKGKHSTFKKTNTKIMKMGKNMFVLFWAVFDVTWPGDQFRIYFLFSSHF